MVALSWRQTARDDLVELIDYIAQDNIDAAIRLLDEIERKVEQLRIQPRLYRLGRVPGTRELVVRPNYVVVYAQDEHAVTILRVLHAARMWPPGRD